MPLKSKPKIKVRRNEVPPGYFLVEADNDEVYFAKERNDGKLTLYKEIVVHDINPLIPIISYYILENDFKPPFTLPVVKVVEEASEEVLVDEGEIIPLTVLIGEPEDYGSEEDLVDEIIEFLKKHLWFRDPRVYLVLACWVLATWLSERFDVFTYILLLGPYGSGKTRVEEVLSLIAFQSIHTASISSASIARLLHFYKGTTLIVDEAQILNASDKVEIIAVLNSGYRKTAKYVRADRDSMTSVKVYDTWGFKVISAPQEIARALETRCIQINMVELPDPRLVNFTLDYAWAKRIRSKLLKFRLKYLNQPLPNPEDIAKILFDSIGDRRLSEIAYPLYVVCPDKYKSHLLTYLSEQAKTRKEEKVATLEATIIQALLNLYHEVENGKLAISIITTEVNGLEERDERTAYDSRYISRVLKTLGFKRTKLTKGKRGIIYDVKLLIELAERYGIEIPEEIKNQKLVEFNKNESHPGGESGDSGDNLERLKEKEPVSKGLGGEEVTIEEPSRPSQSIQENTQSLLDIATFATIASRQVETPSIQGEKAGDNTQFVKINNTGEVKSSYTLNTVKSILLDYLEKKGKKVRLKEAFNFLRVNGIITDPREFERVLKYFCLNTPYMVKDGWLLEADKHYKCKLCGILLGTYKEALGHLEKAHGKEPKEEYLELVVG